jgi:hypothetical protein
MERLDEQALRRHDFVAGTPVVLADNQPWSLRRPLVWFVPNDGNPSGFTTVLNLEPDDDFQALLDRRAAIFREHEGGKAPVVEIVGVEFAIGKRLLLANYDLTPEQLGRVLRWGYGKHENPEGARIREEVLDVAEGLGPKLSPDGTDASPTPSGE